MGRTWKPITATGITADLARSLRLHVTQQPIRTLAEKTGYSTATLSDALGGVKLPTWPVTRSLVEIFDGNVEVWHERWAHAESNRIIKARRTLKSGLTAHEILQVVAGPVPIPYDDLHSVEEFMKWLGRVRIWAGQPTVRQIATRAGKPAATMSDFIKNKNGKLPKFEKVIEYLQGCGVSSGEVYAEWRFIWNRLQTKLLEGPTTPKPGDPRHLTAV
ncbi:MAG: hypothetical protein ABWX68_08295 [Arthrobacter sp.]|uniref:hypothetical protein n=1 Tax=Arthrobacter sp. TaxID=1667 RepID=UPI00349A36C4